MDLTKEVWVMLSDKPIFNKNNEIIDYEHETADIIDLKSQIIMTMEGHVFHLGEVDLVNPY